MHAQLIASKLYAHNKHTQRYLLTLHKKNVCQLFFFGGGGGGGGGSVGEASPLKNLILCMYWIWL